ncbi:MAG: zinc ribbon domain-containing protein [Candidatus Sulfotelmatobacter sp.]
MDHPCHKCGHDVEDGKAFCSQCGAPQIRVILPEDAAPRPSPLPGSVAAAENSLKLDYPVLPADPSPMVKLHALQPCALAAGAAVLLVFLGLNPFVTVLGAGFLAVTFSRRGGQITISAGAGAKLGALTGLLLFAVSTILEFLAVVVLHKGAEIRGEMMDKIQQAASRYPGPEVQPFLDFVKSPNGFTTMLIASLIFGLLAFIALGSIGGAIGATLLGRKNRP